jgi:hypothetical protein
MHNFLVWLWKIYRRPAKARPGWQQGKPKAWVVRLPAAFIDHNSRSAMGSFQTVVMAESEIMAWETAMGCDIWEKLPFEIKYAQVFPREVPTCEKT